MNKELEYLLGTGDVTDVRSLAICDNATDEIEYYVTQYEMNSKLGPMNWWCTWKNPEQKDKDLWLRGSFYVNDARARLYFPACLDTRIPPENREGIDEWLKEFGLKKYDKFNIIVATKGLNPNRLDYAVEIAPKHCDYNEIHAIDEVVAEYQRDLD
jgi:hypothetical protein